MLNSFTKLILIFFSALTLSSCSPIIAANAIKKAEVRMVDQEKSGVSVKARYAFNMGRAYLEQAKLMKNEGEYERSWILADEAFQWFKRAEQESGYLSKKKR